MTGEMDLGHDVLSPGIREELRRSAGQRRLDRCDRGLCFRAVRAAGLRHVRPAATALAAERFRAPASKIDRVKPRYEIIGDADHDSRLAVGTDADDSDHAGAKLFLAVVGEAAQVF